MVGYVPDDEDEDVDGFMKVAIPICLAISAFLTVAILVLR